MSSPDPAGRPAESIRRRVSGRNARNRQHSDSDDDWFSSESDDENIFGLHFGEEGEVRPARNPSSRNGQQFNGDDDGLPSSDDELPLSASDDEDVYGLNIEKEVPSRADSSRSPASVPSSSPHLASRNRQQSNGDDDALLSSDDELPSSASDDEDVYGRNIEKEVPLRADSSRSPASVPSSALVPSSSTHPASVPSRSSAHPSVPDTLAEPDISASGGVVDGVWQSPTNLYCGLRAPPVGMVYGTRLACLRKGWGAAAGH